MLYATQPEPYVDQLILNHILLPELVLKAECAAWAAPAAADCKCIIATAMPSSISRLCCLRDSLLSSAVRTETGGVAW